MRDHKADYFRPGKQWHCGGETPGRVLINNPGFIFGSFENGVSGNHLILNANLHPQKFNITKEWPIFFKPFRRLFPAAVFFRKKNTQVR